MLVINKFGDFDTSGMMFPNNAPGVYFKANDKMVLINCYLHEYI